MNWRGDNEHPIVTGAVMGALRMASGLLGEVVPVVDAAGHYTNQVRIVTAGGRRYLVTVDVDEAPQEPG